MLAQMLFYRPSRSVHLMKVSPDEGFVSWVRLLFGELKLFRGAPRFTVVKDPVFPNNDTPKSKYEKLENRISKPYPHSWRQFSRQLR